MLKLLKGKAEPKLLPAAVVEGGAEQKVAEAAYYLAEKRGFAPGGELADWLEAERQVGCCPLPDAVTAPRKRGSRRSSGGLKQDLQS